MAVVVVDDSLVGAGFLGEGGGQDDLAVVGVVGGLFAPRLGLRRLWVSE
jgi:hypothetical protein